MKRFAAWMALTAVAGVCASHTPVTAATLLARSAVAVHTTARAQAPRHSHHRRHHAPVATLRATHRTEHASWPAAPRRQPRHDRHHATVPVISHTARPPRDSKGGGAQAIIAPIGSAQPITLVRALGLHERLRAVQGVNPEKSGRGPPRAGPSRTLVASALRSRDPEVPPVAPHHPLHSPSTSQAVLGAPASLARVSTRRNTGRRSCFPRPASGRLRAYRPEGAGTRLIMPSNGGFTCCA
jgi:hypothetical protein